MGSTSPVLPCLDLTKDSRALEQGTNEWELSCRTVLEALETYGCLLVRYDKLTGEVSEEMFAAMRSLFDLPVETKRRNETPGPYYTYVGPSELVPHYETLAVMNPTTAENARAFTELMWPGTDNGFCNTLGSMSKKMSKLAKIMMRMIIYSYRLGSNYDSSIESTDALFRMIRYSAPMSEEPASGLVPHTDGNYITTLYQNGIDGILSKSREGEWFQVNPGNGCYVVIVGQALRALSNGRLHAPLHKVMISGGKDRYTCGLFLMPKGNQIVEAAAELVDEEHRSLFKPFNYMDFLEYACVNHAGEEVLDTYAGI